MAEINGVKYEGILAKGFGLIPRTLTRDKDLSIEAKAIYAYLAAFAGNNNEAFPSVELICAELDISRNRYFKHRKSLLEKGYIRIRRERLESGFSKNHYELVQMIPETVCIQNVDIRNVDIRNVDIGIVDIGNEATNSNSLNKNNINSNSNKENITSCKQDSAYSAVVDYLNLKANTKYKSTAGATKKLIKARLDEGFTIDDFKTVIDKKVATWLHDPQFSQYLRPSTLFQASKFEGYLNERVRGYESNRTSHAKEYSDGINF
ncbi:MAG TPA: conserved phage C-terminal domain-containing protein [Kurthia gibsonii]|nr:conserved phage C-terminal domain-containing protein [Kurthia gibsonii]